MSADSHRYRFGGRCRAIHAVVQLPEVLQGSSLRRDDAGKPPLCTGSARATLVVMNPGLAAVDCGFERSLPLSRIAAQCVRTPALCRVSTCCAGRPGYPAMPSGRRNCSRRYRLWSSADMRCSTWPFRVDSPACGDACRCVVGLRSTTRRASSAGAWRRTNAAIAEGVRVQRSLFRLLLRAVAGRRRASTDRATAAAATVPTGAGVPDAGWRVAVSRRTVKTVAPASTSGRPGSPAAECRG